MAELTISPATGSQITTQNPQTAPTQTIGASTKSGGVQPGTTRSLLESQGGQSLHTSALTTVSMAASPSTQSQTQPKPLTQPAQHHANAAIFIIPVVLCVIAAGLFWSMARSAKTTTD